MDILDQIIERKKREVQSLKVSYQERENSHAFLKALQQEGLSVIGEIKRKSPSKGDINLKLDPLALAQTYEKGGVAAFSVLTDYEGFGGTLHDLQIVKKGTRCPVLRKDFIVDPVQISESIAAGADALLLIVRALGQRTKEFLRLAEKQGIDALVEIHDEEELKIAAEAGAKIIGINHRDLRTFHVDLSRSKELIHSLPQDCIKVAESGVKTIEDARLLYEAGFDAVLIGEALVTAQDPQTFIEEIHAIR
ncbi:MAG: indole-3-glycerol phosphate synthase TrpC [Chlamydiia bacterium]|nr:indole-3-glycerol phosphate synthase TrpC [Chlamydiia bacterium]